MPTVQDLIDARFGASTEVEPLAAQSAAVADAIMLQQNPRRIAFTLSNTSVNAIRIRRGAPVSNAANISIPAGGILTVGYPDDLNLAAYEWHVDAPAGASTFDLLAVQFSQEPGQQPTGLGAF